MNQQELLTKMILDAWYGEISKTEKLFDSLSDEQLELEVNTSRNRALYLLGHLAAVHDRMLPLLGFEDQRHPEFNDAFLTSPDKSGKEMPDAAFLRKYWKDTNALLAQHFSKLSAE